MSCCAWKLVRVAEKAQTAQHFSTNTVILWMCQEYKPYPAIPLLSAPPRSLICPVAPERVAFSLWLYHNLLGDVEGTGSTSNWRKIGSLAYGLVQGYRNATRRGGAGEYFVQNTILGYLLVWLRPDSRLASMWVKRGVTSTIS